MRKVLFIAVLLTTNFNTVIAQTLPVGTPALEDYYRREQLLGRVDSNVSFTLKPVLFAAALGINGNIFYPDSILSGSGGGMAKFANGKGYIYLLPFSLQTKVNTSYPYGWNDGAMIPAKGAQTMLTGGIFFKYGPLTIQFKPEYVYAANLPYNGFAAAPRTNEELIAYYRFFNNIDQPERLSNGSYSKGFLGQSSIRLNFNPISVGLSNENVWWGPGINNSLMLGNNAPGFKYITVNTSHPIRSILGHFEGQVLSGRLEGTNMPPLPVTRLSDGNNLYQVKKSDWRYFTGFNINYQPKWIKGLTLGLTRTFVSYSRDLKGIKDYLPFFIPYQKINTNDGDPFPRDQRTSIYARWLFTKAHAEVYFEFARNDNSYNYRDFAGSPDHSRAYLFGARKILPLNSDQKQNILIGFEITQISESIDRMLSRPPSRGGWYTHYQVLHGYTHMGQVLGAGGGGNVQTVEVSWISGLKKLGVSFERFERNTSLANRSFSPINGNSRNWVDISLALKGEWDINNFILNTQIQPIKSLNYQWFMKDYTPTTYYVPNNDAYNIYASLGATYRF